MVLIAGSDKCDKIYNLAKCAMAEAPDVSAFHIV